MTSTATTTRGDGRYSTRELAELAGVTVRQLDHWARSGVFGPPANLGSGVYRRWDPALVGPVRVMGRIQRALSAGRAGTGAKGVGVANLARIIDCWGDGRLELAEGISITWEKTS